MSISISSRKAKGRKLQDFVRDILRDVFRNELDLDDIRSAIMGESGTDIKFSPVAKKKILLDIETKNQEKFSINSAMSQSEKNSTNGRIPIVVFSKNRDDVYISLKFIDFIKLIYPDWKPMIKINKKSVIPIIQKENEENV